MKSYTQHHMIRDEIMMFANALENQMQYNERRGKGDEWKTADPEFLFERLKEEVEELAREIYTFTPAIKQENIRHESKDVGSLAFFIWYNSMLKDSDIFEVKR